MIDFCHDESRLQPVVCGSGSPASNETRRAAGISLSVVSLFGDLWAGEGRQLCGPAILTVASTNPQMRGAAVSDSLDALGCRR